MNKLRKLALLAFIAVVVAMLVMAGIGATLEPTQVATRQAVFGRTPEEVWVVISRFDRSPEWRTDVDGVVIESGAPIRFVEMGPQGPVPLEVTEQERPHKQVLMTADPTLPFSGAWTYELVPVDEGTRLTLTEERTLDNPLYRFVARVFMDPAATVDTYLVDLGRHFGEDVQPAPPL